MRTYQPFDEHVAIVAKYINQRSDAGAMVEFNCYVITQSVSKMERRFRARKHQHLFSNIVGLPAGDLTWNKNYVSQPNKCDRNFLTRLHSVPGSRALQLIMEDLEEHRKLGRVSADSPHQRILSELDSDRPRTARDLFPNLMRVDPKEPHILSKETYREFHQLLCLLILGYKRSLEKLKAARDLKVAPTLSDLKYMIHNIWAT